MKHIDVLFLQETRSDVGNEADWNREWEGELVLSHNTTLSGGVGFLFSRGFTPTSLEVRHVVEWRCLLVRARFEHFNVVFINIYAPNNGTERKHFFENMNDILNSCGPEDYLFVGGDFNCTENEILDRNHAEPHPVSQHALRQLVSSHGLVDHTLNVTRDITRSIRDLETDIVDLECTSESTGNRGYIEILKTKKMALANLLDTKVQGALVRSRIQNITEMDAPSSFFFGLEKKQGQRRQIHSLLSETGQELTEPGINTGLIALDQEKAFDRVEHDFLWKVMERFGFSAGLIAKIKVLYSDIESVLKFNGGLCAPFRVHRGVRQGCALSGMLYALSLEPLLQKIRSSVRGLLLPGFNSRLVLSAYADDVIVFIKDQQDVHVLNSVIEKFSVVSAARVNWRKSEALAVGEWREGLPVLPQNLIWRREGLRYLGVYLGNKDTERKNWEEIIQKVDNKLAKWRWLHPQISFRGRVLILNNLVASMLWHRLACLDPPTGLIVQIQVKIVNFFWDKLHWIPQSVLYLSRDEGGQGLVHLASRTATFRLQFIQKYLTGPDGLVWRDVASCILRRVNNLGLDAALFLTDFKFLKLGGLPPFYQGVFKSWGLFKCKRSEKCNSLYWLLKEPLICGAKMDVCCSTVPGLMAALCSSSVTCLKQLVDAAGPELTDVQALGSVLGVRSVRLTQRSLELWRRRLTEERVFLFKYGRGEAEPDPTDPYPEIHLCPGFTELSGPLLRHSDGETLSLHKADKKTLYTNCKNYSQDAPV
ncbi:Transposon TX1 uncharacterized protein [Merluccius polli]|uniref:Transposon TX1 uncharacterized protein n=1 Tax=Merluccius polli TaxID=89951 RepID=A0AA47MXJ7_MERPO|nr:Transposon TX1 uncharacterized protein [Merluccius polli]